MTRMNTDTKRVRVIRVMRGVLSSGMLRTTAVAAILGLTFTASAAQQPQFRGGVELVTVDVRVLDKDGDPVLGLPAEAFGVKVDGKAGRSSPCNCCVRSPLAMCRQAPTRQTCRAAGAAGAV